LSKKKIIVLSDHALSTSGVGVQTRHLINGLIKKGCWSFKQLGAAIKHTDYSLKQINDDFVIKPIDGFGNKDMMRNILITEKPDAIILFTDPRFFLWLFEIEDEIHQVCPIFWWHVWDNRPTPLFNSWMYEATDAINCHSYLTYQMCSENFPEKSRFIPHAIPENIFHEISDEEKIKYKTKVLGEDKKDHFVAFWANRNARRKRPGDLLNAWKLFLDKTDKKDAMLILHTDPFDNEGVNIPKIIKMLNIEKNVAISTDKIDFDEMNIMYNISDITLNISFAEGFGLSTLESMQTGTPIVSITTGGLTRQVIDHRDNSENGVAIKPVLKNLVGSQNVPYIYEDYVSTEDVADGILKMYSLDEKSRKKLSFKVKKYAKEEFSYEKTIDMWHDSIDYTITNWKKKRQNIYLEEF
jgi:glycosyltransferase involved in cell wall biosynthesis